MSEFRLLLRNLFFHWRTNLAVIAGLIAGTAVIGGALIVGDSVRGSLRQLSLDRLGGIDFALIAPRFFRQELADDVARRPEFAGRFAACAPVLVVAGPFTAEHGGETRRAGQVQIFGIDDRMASLLAGMQRAPQGDEVDLNQRLADELGVRAGDAVSLLVRPPSAIPRESLLGKRDGDFHEIPFKVRTVFDAASTAARLALNPTQQLPQNAFVSLAVLQQGLGLERTAPSAASPRGQSARVNALFVSARSPADQTGPAAPEAARALDAAAAAGLTLADLDLRLAISPRGYVSVESEQQILADVFATAALEAARRLAMPTSEVFDYLANELVNVRDPKKFSMYSVVAGLDPVSTTAPPFGPFAWKSARPARPLAADEIVLNEWIAQDLAVGTNDEVRLRYHLVTSHGDLPEEERTFRVAGLLKLEGPSADPNLVPVVKGITNAKTFRDWEQPFPMKLERVTPRDDQYWTKYRATPKSFVSLETARKLWGSRFGSLTSVRVAPATGQSPAQAAAALSSAIVKSLAPDQTGMTFRPVKAEGVNAAVGSNDFSQLFLGFSFFLILAASILVGMIFRLGIERRGTTVGLLTAVGFTPRRLRRLFMEEGLVLVVVGGLLGVWAAVEYAQLMVYGLTHWWNQAVGTRALSVYVRPSTLATGFFASAAVGILAVLWGLRQLKFLSPRELLSGAAEPAASALGKRRRSRRSLSIGAVLGAVASVTLVAAAAGFVPRGEAFEGLTWTVVLFFIDGMALLAGGVLLLAGLLDGERSAAVHGRGAAGIARLGLRNTARHRQRSTASVALIATATFVIVAVAAGRRNPAVESPDKFSGNGGFRIVAESSAPILYNLGSPEGRVKLDLRPAAGSADAALLDRSHFFAFRVKAGEDASCLNVYQTRVPTILGVPPSFIERGGFRFIGARRSNPWTRLEQVDSDGTIPVFGDANTLQYSLHKSPGETVAVPDEANPKFRLKVAGMLDGSVFQGVLLMSETNFRRLFPEVEGYRYFLVEPPEPAANAERLSALLESQLSPYGFDAEPVALRLAAFLAVQNTYLSTFQALGGLGLLLGTLGLATVMIRNVLERRRELALLGALGFSKGGRAWLVLVETAALLVCGLATGTVAALVAMVPHLSSTGADVPWGSLAAILALVFLVGMAAALLASFEAAETPILDGLRSE